MPASDIRAGDEAPVLIAGGGMVGLSAATFLAQQGRPIGGDRAPRNQFAAAAQQHTFICALSKCFVQPG